MRATVGLRTRTYRRRQNPPHSGVHARQGQLLFAEMEIDEERALAPHHQATPREAG